MADREFDIGLRSIWGYILVILFVFSALSLLSYNFEDIPLLKARAMQAPNNFIGPVGAYASFTLFITFGIGAYLVPLWCLSLGVLLIMNKEEVIWPKFAWATSLTLALSLIPELQTEQWARICEKLNLGTLTSGITGKLIMKVALIKAIGPIGAALFLAAVIIVSIIMLTGRQNIALVYGVITGSDNATPKPSGMPTASERDDQQKKIEKEERKLEKQRKRLENSLRKQEEAAQRKEEAALKKKQTEKKPSPKKKPAEKKQPKKEKSSPSSAPLSGSSTGYQLPPINLLQYADKPGKEIKIDSATTSRIMIETLSDFGIDVEVTNVEKGPVVTRYELLPAPGVRVEKISGLANNLALSLKATSVRVQAPVPGKGVVGIEVPNETAKMVSVREVIESDAWKADDCHLPLVLGKDVAGNDMVVDLAKAPHMLVAGATGAGKTVCMNSILSGLLMSRTPEQLRLILVDPKIVEFSAFKELPHLVVPVITDPKKVALGLRWAINEMEKRYKLFAKVGVRNIDGYNTRKIVKQEEMFNVAPGVEENYEQQPPRTVPYIVIVVDELADLMLSNGAEIENCVARLAQLSRAVGIHMILSTQRPSVNVITGTIKANFPARIAFQVAQKVDSRTILDAIGADKLLGRGDMLYLPPASSKLIRIQGSMMFDEDINRIVDFIKNQAAPNYIQEIREKIEKSGSGAIEFEEDEELMTRAVNVIQETQRASTSSLQRRLRIGYTRAARIMDILEEQGVVGPPRGSDPREILIDLDGEIPNNE